MTRYKGNGRIMAAFKKKRPINANYSPFRFQLALIDCPVLIEALAVALGRINFCKLIKSGTGHAYRARSLCKRFPRNGETRAKRMNERTNERMNEWNEPIQRSPPPPPKRRLAAPENRIVLPWITSVVVSSNYLYPIGVILWRPHPCQRKHELFHPHFHGRSRG